MTQLLTILKDMIDVVGGLFAFTASQTMMNIQMVITGFSRGGEYAIGAIFPLAILAVQASLILVVLDILRMVAILVRGIHLGSRHKAFSVTREGGPRILIIGDSTAYGTGADKPEDSIAGLFAHDFPNVTIINLAINESVTKEAITQLEQAGPGPFDLIVVSTGGNDVWKRTPYPELEAACRELFTKAIEKSNHQVVALSYSNFSNMSIFPGFIRSYLGKRSKRIHDIFAQVTGELNIPLVELFTAKKVDEFFPNPFMDDPEKYYAPDHMHPSSAGYRLWYNHMWLKLPRRRFTFTNRQPATLEPLPVPLPPPPPVS